MICTLGTKGWAAPNITDFGAVGQYYSGANS